MARQLSRRRFMTGSTAAAAALAGAPAVHARQDSPPIRVGLIGCGGRGTGAAENCMESLPNVQLVAMADLFEDRLKTSRRQLEGLKHAGMQVTDANCFVGFDAYRKLIHEAGVDLVLLTTPPGFRPLHFAEAVAAGKHVFFEKPVAVDPVGVRKVIEIGEQARKKGLAVVVGTQNRHDPGVIETMKRIHDGQIGRIIQIRSYRNSGPIWVRPRTPGQSDMEYMIRNWYYFNWLSGDHIVEQHIHLQDLCDWAAGSHPLRAVGIGGRIQRTGPEYGNIYDNFGIDYEYPEGVHCMHMGRQMKRCSNHIGVYVAGTLGEAHVHLKQIVGPNAWKYDKKDRPSTVLEHADLIASIRAEKPLNEARRAAESTMTSILGRESAYTGQLVQWDALMKSDQDLSPPKYEFGAWQTHDVPIPGGKDS
jgi:predicted dehydrogenase